MTAAGGSSLDGSALDGPDEVKELFVVGCVESGVVCGLGDLNFGATKLKSYAPVSVQ